MIPEVAMEQYINLLSEKIPGWRGEKTRVSLVLGSKGAFALFCDFLYGRADIK